MEFMPLRSRRTRGTWALVLVLGLGLAAAASSARAGVSLSFTPPTLTVAPGAQFDLELTVYPAGSNFNGFDATVAYNPAALTLVPLSPTTQQQGCLMTGACS